MVTFQVRQTHRLPASKEPEIGDESLIRHGYAVRPGRDDWYFFQSRVPAYAFARAAEMSNQFAPSELRRAAWEGLQCPTEMIGGGEKILWLGKQINCRISDELLGEFAEGTWSGDRYWMVDDDCVPVRLHDGISGRLRELPVRVTEANVGADGVT